MTEEFLQHIWKFRLFDNLNLTTSTQESIEIIKVGGHNSNSGPDFFNSKIKIGKTLWAGNVEVHLLSSDWKKHKHTSDKAYNNIILHVVYENDEPICRLNGDLIPTIELKNRFNKNTYNKYVDFKSNKNWIPCEKQINIVPQIVINAWLDRILIERLERKANYILESLKQNKK